MSRLISHYYLRLILLCICLFILFVFFFLCFSFSLFSFHDHDQNNKLSNFYSQMILIKKFGFWRTSSIWLFFFVCFHSLKSIRFVLLFFRLSDRKAHWNCASFCSFFFSFFLSKHIFRLSQQLMWCIFTCLFYSTCACVSNVDCDQSVSHQSLIQTQIQTNKKWMKRGKTSQKFQSYKQCVDLYESQKKSKKNYSHTQRLKYQLFFFHTRLFAFFFVSFSIKYINKYQLII